MMSMLMIKATVGLDMRYYIYINIIYKFMKYIRYYLRFFFLFKKQNIFKTKYVYLKKFSHHCKLNF